MFPILTWIGVKTYDVLIFTDYVRARNIFNKLFMTCILKFFSGCTDDEVIRENLFL